MRVFFFVLAVALAVGCGGAEEVDTEVRVHATVDETLDAQLLNVRVYDTDRQLASERIQDMTGASQPVVVPLFPGGEGARSYHVVLTLLAPNGTQLGIQRVIGDYMEGEQRVVRVHFSASCAATTCSGRETCIEEDGAPRCVHACFDPQPRENTSLSVPHDCPNEVYVDGATGTDDPAACFGPEAPCQSVSYALDNYLTGRIGGVINVHGGATYPAFGISTDESGTEQTPTVIRAWPGTGRPLFDGDGRNPGISTCCSADSANHLVLERLDVVDGLLQGILLHGTAVQDAEIRHCGVSSTQLPNPEDGGVIPFPSQAGAIVVTNQASGVRLINNIVHFNDAVGVDGDGEEVGTIGIAVTGNRVLLENNFVDGSSGHGIRVFGNTNRLIGNVISGVDLQGISLFEADDAVLEDNTICNARGAGVEAIQSLRGVLRHNTVVESMGDGVVLRDASDRWELSRNVFAFNMGAGIARSGDGSEPTDQQNLYWMNGEGPSRSTMSDGMDWRNTVEPAFLNLVECNTLLDPNSESARLIDGGPIGARLPDNR